MTRRDEAQMVRAFQSMEAERRRGRPLNHVPPRIPVQGWRAFHILSPASTHFRVGTCDEAGCLAYRNGWATKVDEATDLGQKQAHYIRKLAGRKYTEAKEPSGLTAFTFEAGQKCFATHQVPLDRPEFFAVGHGDWRQYSLPRLHGSPDSWVNDFGEHQDRINKAVNG